MDTLNTFSQDFKKEGGGWSVTGTGGEDMQKQLDELCRRMNTMSTQFQSLLNLQSGSANTNPFTGQQHIFPPVVTTVSPSVSFPSVPPTAIPVSTNMSTVTTTLPMPSLPGVAQSSPAALSGGTYTSSSYGLSNRPVVSPGMMNFPVTSQARMSNFPAGGVHSSPTSMSPAGWLADPLTSALHQLSTVVDPDSVSRSAGMPYRPEYYVQHCLNSVPLKSIDYKKLSYRSLIYGMVCVARYVVSVGGNVDSYLSHMEFLCRHASENSYTDIAYAEYDHNVVDRFIKSPSNGFPVADAVALGYSFHPAKLAHDVEYKKILPTREKKGRSNITNRVVQMIILVQTAISGTISLAGTIIVINNILAGSVKEITEQYHVLGINLDLLKMVQNIRYM